MLLLYRKISGFSILLFTNASCIDRNRNEKSVRNHQKYRYRIMTEQNDRASWLIGPQAVCANIPLPLDRPWRLILLGAPGVGKGTQAEFICDRLKACHLSTGDVFRAATGCDDDLSPAMLEALKYMKKGQLVPNNTVIEMVRERARCLSCQTGFLLDGFPRTVEQAEALEDTLTQLNQTIDGVLSYELPMDEVISRLSGRRTCRSCKTTFHLKAKPPQKPGICDKCGGELYQRDDDQADAIKVRLDAYETSTAPLTDYYGKKGKLIRISAEGTPEEVFARTLKILKGE